MQVNRSAVGGATVRWQTPFFIMAGMHSLVIHPAPKRSLDNNNNNFITAYVTLIHGGYSLPPRASQTWPVLESLSGPPDDAKLPRMHPIVNGSLVVQCINAHQPVTFQRGLKKHNDVSSMTEEIAEL